MTAADWFGFVGLIAGAVAAVLAVMGWLVPMADGSTRYGFRLFAFIALTAYVILINASSGPHHWYGWVLYIAALAFCCNRVGHWWRRTEAARKGAVR